jgi:hypothetical protein
LIETEPYRGCSALEEEEEEIRRKEEDENKNKKNKNKKYCIKNIVTCRCCKYLRLQNVSTRLVQLNDAACVCVCVLKLTTPTVLTLRLMTG